MTKHHVTITTYGQKYRAAIPSDMHFLVTHLPNPHQLMAELDGRHDRVRGWLNSHPQFLGFVDHVYDRIIDRFAIYHSAHPGVVRVSVSCYGGRHRSVALAEEVADRLRESGVEVDVHHMELEK